MPASEQTWRNQNTLHAVFGISSLVLLVFTVWMLAVDHTREWKEYQTSQRKIDQFYLSARISEEKTAKYISQKSEKESALLAEKSSLFDEQLIAQFKEAAASSESETIEFNDFDEQYEQYKPLVEQAEQARQEAKTARDKAIDLTAQANKAIAENSENADALRDEAEEAQYAALDAEESAHELSQQAADIRSDLVQQLRDIVQRVKFREDILSQKKKVETGKLTAVVSLRDIALGQGQPYDSLQQEADELKEKLVGISEQLNKTSDLRKKLESLLQGDQGLLATENQLSKELDELESSLTRLHKSQEGWWEWLGRKVVGLPVIDAFDTSDQEITQVWLPDLTINYNFSDVARFDRCISCHRSIEKTAPGSAVEPAYPAQKEPLEILLATPTAEPVPDLTETESAEPEDLDSRKLRQWYGLKLAEKGLLQSDNVLIEVVWPETPAANAGLKMGDVIEEINGEILLNRNDAVRYLVQVVDWGKPIKLRIRRGLPHPFASHPRLDLFLGSLSPHKMQEVGCTICHDGQGSATAFKWASHTPDNPIEATRWRREHGWFDNHHWIFPMYSSRFVESGCLKCHYEVESLEPSERFPEPPAPKVVAGFNTIRKYGCFGCHEINGFDGPHKRVGPDMRLEPNFSAVAQSLLATNLLGEQETKLAERLVSMPSDNSARHLLQEAILEDEQISQAAQQETKSSDSKESEEQAKPATPRFSSQVYSLGKLLKDIEIPGTYRKVGPSLHYLASKTDFEFLYSWIEQPSNFRPSTRMPQFFGLHDHLSGQGLQESEKYEPIEIRALTEILLNNSGTFDYLEPPESVTESPSVERGKLAFQMRGCLACHSHDEFPEIKQDQGPDLSRIGSKFNSEKGRKWLYSWIKQPEKYHPRTKMPNLFLDPIAGKENKVTDPAADIVAYLTNTNDWKPAATVQREMTAEDKQALYDLSFEYLSKQYPKYRAKQYLEEGMPKEIAAKTKGDDRVLVGLTNDPAKVVAKQMEYLGLRTISKYGCYGCHDIPGFEGAKPIGTALADWGRKEPSKLAFEQITSFLATHGISDTPNPQQKPASAAHSDVAQGDQPDHSSSDHATSPDENHSANDHADAHTDHQENGHQESGHAHVHHDLNPEAHGEDVGYYLENLLHHNRIGFLWQKLRMPRSYDYAKTENKSYNERLKMPRFPFTPEEREKVMTFVLGLVAEPPATKYLYQPQGKQKAIVEGRQVLEKFNCGGCHILDMDRWEFDYRPGTYGPPPPADDYPFLKPHFTSQQIEKSLKTDRSGKLHAVLHGMPIVDANSGKMVLYDEEEDPVEPEDAADVGSLFTRFEIYRPTLVDGEIREVGGPAMMVPLAGTKTYPAWGGGFARYLLPVAFKNAVANDPGLREKGAEVWGWVPPPLVGEGRKVQPEWLHGFLLEPYPIRPATVLRMPKFNMSHADATKLVNYFAAADNVVYPYDFNRRTSPPIVSEMTKNNPNLLSNGLKIVVDNNYCVKCHLVGDFVPKGSDAALAPNLADVHRRLRPEWLRDWVANPKRTLPYTGMPVNIPHGKGISQEIFPGTPTEQLEGLVDFLMNYNTYTNEKVSIKSQVKPPPVAPPAATGN